MFSISAKAQINLVPNYSFEQKDSCPSSYGGVDYYCKYWFTPINFTLPTPPVPYSINGSGSSDYFNICSSNSIIRIPSNNIGFQYPVTGDAYIGINLLYSPFDNFKEYIEVELFSSLVKGREYCISLNYSIANNFNYYQVDIGVLITDSLVYRESGNVNNKPKNLNFTPTFKQKLPQVVDTVNWIFIDGSFIANGGERYLTIGNFQNTEALENKDVYVFIDDVKLYYCGSDTTPQPTDSMIVPNVFTPNDDGYNDKFEFKNQEQWEYETQIFNRWGHLIFDNSKSENWDGYLNGVQATPGVYYYVIRAAAIKTGEVVVYRGTVTVLY